MESHVAYLKYLANILVMLIAGELGLTLTSDTALRQSPSYCACSSSLEMVPLSQGRACPDNGNQRKAEEARVLAGVAGCGRCRKQGYRGKPAPGFKL